MDKDVYYDIPIFQNLYSFVPEKNQSSKKDLVNISIENIMQLEPYKNREDLEIENKKKKDFLLLFLLLLFFFFVFLFFYFHLH
jgi:hypothetical protein